MTAPGDLRRAVPRAAFSPVSVRASSSRLLLLLVPAVGYLIVIFVWPLIDVLKRSLVDPRLTLEHYRTFVDVPIYPRVLLTSVEIALLVTAICILLGYPTAYLITHARRRASTVLIVLVTVPFFTSILVRNYAWIFLLSNNGVINSTLEQIHLTSQPLSLLFNRSAVVIGMVSIELPYMILVLLGVMRTLDDRLMRAAESLGSAPFTAFRRVYLPLTLPGVASGAILVFVLSMAFYVTPAMLGGPRDRMMANAISEEMDQLHWGFAAALAVILLLITALIVIVGPRLLGAGALFGREDGARSFVYRSKVRENRLTRLLDDLMNPVWRYVPYATTGAVLLLLVAPIVVMIPLSFSSAQYFAWPPPGFSLRWYGSYFHDASWIRATKTSFEVAGMTAVLTLTLALPAAFGLVRSRSRLRLAAYGLLVFPAVVPGIVTAIAVFFFFTRIHLRGTLLGVALGHVIGALPLATLVLVAALRNFDTTLERAASSLGAGPIRTLRRVTLPVLATAAITAALFAFLHSFDELLVALFVSGVSTETLPKKMWESLQEIDPTITAVSVLLALIAAAALVLVAALQWWGSRQRDSALGRS